MESSNETFYIILGIIYYMFVCASVCVCVCTLFPIQFLFYYKTVYIL